MDMFFHQEEQWDHVNGSIIRWTDLANQTTWDIKNAKARANILLCMKKINWSKLNCWKHQKKFGIKLKLIFRQPMLLIKII
jgi:hypothetical protein